MATQVVDAKLPHLKSRHRLCGVDEVKQRCISLEFIDNRVAGMHAQRFPQGNNAMHSLRAKQRNMLSQYARVAGLDGELLNRDERRGFRVTSMTNHYPFRHRAGREICPPKVPDLDRARDGLTEVAGHCPLSERPDSDEHNNHSNQDRCRDRDCERPPTSKLRPVGAMDKIRTTGGRWRTRSHFDQRLIR